MASECPLVSSFRWIAACLSIACCEPVFAQPAEADGFIQRDILGAISQAEAQSLIGRWTLFNCDVEIRLVPADRLCASDCTASLHAYFFDRVRSNAATITLAVVSAKNVGARALVGTEVVSDTYAGIPGHLSYFRRAIRGWSGGTRSIFIASDFLESYQPRWHVQCAPQ